MISLNLIICFLKFNTSSFKFNLHKRKSINKDCHIITALLPTLYGYLIGNLKLILAPLLSIQERHPYYLTILKLKILKIAKFLRLFKAGTTLQMKHDFIKLSLRKRSTAKFFKSLAIMFFQLELKVTAQILLLLNLHILIAILLQSPDQSLLQCVLALYSHNK